MLLPSGSTISSTWSLPSGSKLRISWSGLPVPSIGAAMAGEPNNMIGELSIGAQSSSVEQLTFLLLAARHALSRAVNLMSFVSIQSTLWFADVDEPWPRDAGPSTGPSAGPSAWPSAGLAEGLDDDTDWDERTRTKAEEPSSLLCSSHMARVSDLASSWPTAPTSLSVIRRV